MTAPVTENELFAALRGYASTLEVQFMIEQELKKFQEKTLPKLLAEAVSVASYEETAVGSATACRGLTSSSSFSGSRTDERTHIGTAGDVIPASASCHVSSLNNGHAASVAAGVAAEVPLKSSSSSPGHVSTPDMEWVQMFLKAHIDDTVARHLPTMISQEVQRQLRVAAAFTSSSSLPQKGTAVHGPNGNNNSSSNEADNRSSNNNNNSGASGVAVNLRCGMGLPPLPPSLSSTSPSSPLDPSSSQGREETAASATSTASATTIAPSPSSSSCAVDEARRQRERILNAIEDIERQVDDLQRAVDVAAEERDVRQRRSAYLCTVMERRMRQQNSASNHLAAYQAADAGVSTLSFQTRLEQLIDTQQEETLINTLESMLIALQKTTLPVTTTERTGLGSESAASQGCADAVSQAVRSPSQLHEDFSSSSPLFTAARQNSWEPQQSIQQPFEQQQQQQMTPEASPMRSDGPIGRGSLYTSEPPSPPPTAPSSATCTRDYGGLLKPATATSEPATPPPALTPTPTKSTSSQVQSPPLPFQQHRPVGVGKGLRSITTKGSAATSPSSGPLSVKGLLTLPTETILPCLPLSSPRDVSGALHNRPSRHPFHYSDHPFNVLNGTAVRRPAPSPRECVDPMMLDGAFNKQAATQYYHAHQQRHLRHPSARRAASASSSSSSLHNTRTKTIAAAEAQSTTRVSMPRDTDETRVVSHDNNTTYCNELPTSSSAHSAPPTKGGGGGAVFTTGTTTGRRITLGIDAVNIPAGVLPDALGRHGAVRVQSVAPCQLAERAGLCRGDILLSVDRRHVRSCEELQNVLTAVPPSQDILLVELYRHTAHQIITVLLKL